MLNLNILNTYIPKFILIITHVENNILNSPVLLLELQMPTATICLSTPNIYWCALCMPEF